jgi:aspartate/methionine/tyrosine aminotransferase
MQILVDHGDEVILPVPYWVSFKDIIQYAGGKVVYLETSEAESFRITADAIEQAITPRTKAIILNSPSNPAGSVVSAEDLERIVHLAHERGIYPAAGRVLRVPQLRRQSRSPAARSPGPRSTWSFSARSRRPTP